MEKDQNKEPRLGVKPDPMARAIEQFDAAVDAEKFSIKKVQNALNKVEKTGNRLGNSPSELFANLARLSAKAAESAAAKGQIEAADTFNIQSQEFELTRGQIVELGSAVEATAPSTPERTTGQAAG